MSDRHTGQWHGRNGHGDPRTDPGAGAGERPPLTPAERARQDAQRRDAMRRHPAAPRPISLTGPSLRDRVNTYRGWPRWARIAAPTAAMAVAGMVGIVGVAQRGDDSRPTLTTGVGGTATSATAGTTEPDGSRSGGSSPGSTGHAGDSGGSTTSAPAGSGPETGTGTSVTTGGGRVPGAGGPDGAPPDGAGGPSDPAAGCHPSYTPCVPVASDVDCEGSNGDGPAYTGQVQVVGPDVYDLDRDHNGITCDRGRSPAVHDGDGADEPETAMAAPPPA